MLRNTAEEAVPPCAFIKGVLLAQGNMRYVIRHPPESLRLPACCGVAARQRVYSTLYVVAAEAAAF